MADRTARECLEQTVRTVQRWIDDGLCQTCALRVASKTLNLDYNTTEKVWIDHQVKLFEVDLD